MRCFVKVMLTICFASLIMAWFPEDSYSLPDLVILKDWITLITDNNDQTTRVIVMVKNIGNQAAGPFTLRIGASSFNTWSWYDFRIPGLLPDAVATREFRFGGIYTCAWGNADILK